jgi:tetratricopeptide (TPR) repeat protein
MIRRSSARLLAAAAAASVLLTAPPVFSAAAEPADHDASADTALNACRALDDVGNPDAAACYREVLSTGTEAVRAEAFWRLGDLERANRSFRNAAADDPTDPDILARWGMLFLAAHQAGDAEELFEEALALDDEHIEALTGMAELLVDRFDGPARSVISRILTLDPDNARAQVLDARLAVEAGELDTARGLLTPLAADQSIPVRHRLAAMAHLAAADHMDGTATPGVEEGVDARPSRWSIQALEINPRYGDVHAVPAHFYVMVRRYREAVAMLERAVAVEPANWAAHSTLGTNLLRVNRIEEGIYHLERAYEGDAFNAETVNTLRLLDTLQEFDTFESDTLILRTHPEETAILKPYVEELVERTFDGMADRYGYEMARPVVLELYQHHDDFGVRTAGLPGLGILGATFGDVVVMDGPSAKTAESFDWYSAVWHELAHVVTLNATDNLVSRWFSEGVSVHEEQRFGPSPNASVPVDFLEALAADRLLPVAELDQGFMRPQYPNQIGVSYVQAGLLCSFIAEEFETGLTDILKRYRQGDTTVAAIENGLGISAAELDDRFFAHLDATYGSAADTLADREALMAAAAAALGQEAWGEAADAAAEAVALFPQHVGPGSAYLMKARAEEEAEQTDAAMETLYEFYQRGGRHPAALARTAELLKEAGRTDDALAVQRTLVRLDPLKIEHHATLGEWLSDEGVFDEALIEFEAVMALNPHDKATAHFQVATALEGLGRTDEARRELLKALEIAPRYPEGLKKLREWGR